MVYEQLKLGNGIRVVVVKKYKCPLVTIKLFVKVGSRQDDALPGLAHLAEHLFLRSYNSSSCNNIYYQIDRLGGKVYASTTKEYTEYSLVILKENFFAGLQLFSEFLTNPNLEEDDIEQEKKIVLEEIINSYSRSNTLWDIFAQAMWEESPLRNPIRGYKDSIQEITGEDVNNFYRQYYTGNNIVIVVIGEIDSIEIHKKMGMMFSGIRKGKQPGITKQLNSHILNTSSKVHITKNSLQTHLLVGFPAVGIKEPTLNAFKLVNKILGNGMSSRLYRKLRIDSRLVYSLSSVLAIYEDAGYFAVWANFNHEKKELILNTLLKEFDSLKKEKICEEELNRAKIRYKIDFLANYDTDHYFADFLGTSLMLTDRIKELEDILLEINSVGYNEVYELANNYFHNDNLFTVSIGKN